MTDETAGMDMWEFDAWMTQWPLDRLNGGAAFNLWSVVRRKSGAVVRQVAVDVLWDKKRIRQDLGISGVMARLNYSLVFYGWRDADGNEVTTADVGRWELFNSP